MTRNKIQKNIMRYHDIGKIQSVCIHKNIPLKCISAIVPAKSKYLPWLKEDLENTTCIIMKDGKRIFFEEMELIPVCTIMKDEQNDFEGENTTINVYKKPSKAIRFLQKVFSRKKQAESIDT